MESLGYDATPPCFGYNVAKKLKLLPVPARLKWANKKDQDKDLLEKVIAEEEEQVHTCASSITSCTNPI